MKTNLTFFGLTTLLLAICLFSAAMPAQAQDVYQRQMDKAFRDNNIPLMKQMLAKGAEIPDISTSSAADKPLAVLKFMMDNGYEPDPKLFFKELFSFTNMPDRPAKFNLFFEKGYFPKDDDSAIKLLEVASEELYPSWLQGQFLKEAEQVQIQKDLFAMYKQLLVKSKKYAHLYNPAYKFLSKNQFDKDMMKFIIENYGSDLINECSFAWSDLYRTHKTEHGRFRLTPLQYAALLGTLDNVKYLVSKGASINTVCTGMTALDYMNLDGKSFTDQPHIDVEMYLVEHGAKSASEL